MADVPLLVLIVDDEPEIRDILKEMLNENGIASITAASGNEAILRLRNRSVVAVLSDIRMEFKGQWDLSDQPEFKDQLANKEFKVQQDLSDQQDI